LTTERHGCFRTKINAGNERNMCGAMVLRRKGAVWMMAYLAEKGA